MDIIRRHGVRSFRMYNSALGHRKQDVLRFIKTAEAFLDCAEVFAKRKILQVEQLSVIYLLIGRALELVLKSCLIMNGSTKNEQKKINHDLTSLIQKAKDVKVLELSMAEKKAIFQLNKYYYERKDLGYGIYEIELPSYEEYFQMTRKILKKLSKYGNSMPDENQRY
ncbi:MAG: hypothetical protein WBE75_05635 [Candidatus Omnitrophota bacterium]